MVFYIGGYLWKRESWKKLSDIDVDSGRRDLDYEAFEALRRKRAERLDPTAGRSDHLPVASRLVTASPIVAVTARGWETSVRCEPPR